MLGDGLGCLDTGYDLVNSIRRDDATLSSGPEGEGDHIPLPNSRTPQDCSQARIADYSAPHEPVESNNTIKQFREHQQTEAARSRCRHAGVPHHVNLNTLAALRERLLAIEDFSARTCFTGSDFDVATAAVQPVASDGLEPEQLQQLQDLIDEYTDQISRSSDDIGCLDPKYKDYYMRIPTEPGARCKQKPYRLSHKENEAVRRQLPILIQQQVKKASGPTDFLSPALFVPKPRNPDELRLCVDYRRLKYVTLRDYHGLPFIRDLQQSMKGCKYFTALDLTWGF